MDPTAIPVFLAGPFPVIHSSRVFTGEEEVELDVGMLIGGMPSILAATAFPLDETWERVDTALTSGDAKLGVAGTMHEQESMLGHPEVFPSAYIGLECANGERLILAHIRSPNSDQDPEAFAREVIAALLNGQTPADLGELIED
jgi:hypothetical protein